MLNKLTKDELEYLYSSYEKEDVESATASELIGALWAYWAFKKRLTLAQTQERQRIIKGE